MLPLKGGLSYVTIVFLHLRWQGQEFKVIVGTLHKNPFHLIAGFKSMVNGLLDVRRVAKTNLDNSFPVVQFGIDGVSIPWMLDSDRDGGEVKI